MSDSVSEARLANVREEVERWLERNWSRTDYEQNPRVWLRKVVDAGYAVPTWDKECFGRGLDGEESKEVTKAFSRLAAQEKISGPLKLGAGQDIYNLGAIVVYKCGSDLLQKELLLRLLTGDVSCLLYSEPNAGSDLAAIRTRADKVGDEFVFSGQKIWTSGAAYADYGLLLARTDWDMPKHRGISFFILPMRQDGIEVKPINQINGRSEFNEVFINEAVAPAHYVVGELNGGWRVLQTALAYERLIMGEGASEVKKNRDGGALTELIDLARRQEKLNDPVLRQRLAQTIAYRHLNKLNMARAKKEIAENGSSSLMSLVKLEMSRVQHSEGALKAEILGASGLLDGPDHPEAEEAHFYAARAYMNSIGGGTDQIQRNIISERLLGLPREVELDRNIPFKEVRTGIRRD